MNGLENKYAKTWVYCSTCYPSNEVSVRTQMQACWREIAHPWSLQYYKEELRNPVHQLIAREVDNKNMHIFKGLTASNKGVKFILGWPW